MNLAIWLDKATKLLDSVGISTARLDALVLLEDFTNKDRAWLLAHPEFNLTRSDLVRLDKAIKRRAGHEPLAYIRGKSEFYGREFQVTPDTLQPRPETETMINLLKNILQHNTPLSKTRSWKIVDVGTGSGCLAITAKLEWPGAEVYATEINEAALSVAKCNAKNLNADIKFCTGNLLEPYFALNSSPSPLVLLCNLPYVPDSHTINQAAMQEPRIAIFGGEDGLDLYREMFKQVEQFSGLGSQDSGRLKYIFTESLPFQHAQLTKIAEKSGYLQTDEEDFIQIFKN